MVAGEGTALEQLLHDRLDYMHSSGHSQSKANLLVDLAGKAFFAELTYAERSIMIVERNGLVKLTVDQVKNIGNGHTRSSRIKVLQVWKLDSHRGWQLLARSSALIGSPVLRSS